MSSVRFLIFLFLFLTFAISQSNAQSIYMSDSGFVKFTSDAPLELIVAESKAIKGIIDVANKTFAFKINTHTFTGFNSILQQEHFYENYIESEKYPSASFAGKIIEDINFDEKGIQMIRAKGILNIHGVKKERIIKVELRNEAQTIWARSTFSMDLDDHNIMVPKLVYQKISERIQIDVSIGLLLQTAAD